MIKEETQESLERRQYFAVEIAKHMCSIEILRNFSEKTIARRAVEIVNEIFKVTQKE